MNSSDALREIQGLAAEGRIRYTDHALNERMPERGVTDADVRRALVTATSAVPRENGSWRVMGGTDIDNDGLDVAVLIDRGALVVTVF